MAWGAFSFASIGPLVLIKSTMDAVMYRDIFGTTYATRNMPRGWIFQQDNDPKHSSKHFFQKEDASSQSPDFNPIEHLWQYLKSRVGQRKHSNNVQLWYNLEAEWNNIPQERITN